MVSIGMSQIGCITLKNVIKCILTQSFLVGVIDEHPIVTKNYNTQYKNNTEEYNG